MRYQGNVVKKCVAKIFTICKNNSKNMSDKVSGIPQEKYNQFSSHAQTALIKISS